MDEYSIEVVSLLTGWDGETIKRQDLKFIRRLLLLKGAVNELSRTKDGRR